MKVVRSSSEFNFSMITIIFDDDTDYYFARERVLEKLSIASTFLPPGVTPYMAPDATAVGQIFWYTVEGEGKDLSELRSIQDWYVRYQLNSVPGVAEVATVGGAPREYQIDLDPNKLRAYGVTLGEVDSAVARSNSSVGGRVIHQGNAEYLIRSVGWIENLDDIRETVVAAARNGTPINVGMLGTVQIGPAFRRSVLEKDGKEAVGGVVLMRYGENPLEVTRRVKEKITTLQAGLPAGVRIVPFYDRTPLIHKALETVSGTVKEELIVCTIAILLVMGHVGNAFVVAMTLPMAVLFSFLMMRLFGMSSNIMSLAGISISRWHSDRSGRRHGRERRASSHAASSAASASRGDTRDRHPGLPDRRPADLLLGLDHDPFVLAGVRPFRPRREDVSPAGVHQDVRAHRRGHPVDHARAGLDPDFSEGPDQVGKRELAGADDDRDFQADAVLAAGSDDAGLLAVRDHPGAGLCRVDEAGPRVHADLDEQSMMDMPMTVPRSLDRPGRARPSSARRDPARLSRGLAGRRQSRPRRDADRLGSAGHDRDAHQPARSRALAQAEASLRRRRCPDASRAG